MLCHECIISIEPHNAVHAKRPFTSDKFLSNAFFTHICEYPASKSFIIHMIISSKDLAQLLILIEFFLVLFIDMFALLTSRIHTQFNL